MDVATCLCSFGARVSLVPCFDLPDLESRSHPLLSRVSYLPVSRGELEVVCNQRAADSILNYFTEEECPSVGTKAGRWLVLFFFSKDRSFRTFTSHAVAYTLRPSRG